MASSPVGQQLHKHMAIVNTALVQHIQTLRVCQNKRLLSSYLGGGQERGRWEKERRQIQQDYCRKSLKKNGQGSRERQKGQALEGHGGGERGWEGGKREEHEGRGKRGGAEE